MTHSIVQRHRGYIIVVINQINQSLGGFLCSTQLELVVEMMMMMQRANARPLRDVNQPVNFVAIIVGKSSWLMPYMTLNVNRYADWIAIDCHRRGYPGRDSVHCHSGAQAGRPDRGPTLYGVMRISWSR